MLDCERYNLEKVKPSYRYFKEQKEKKVSRRVSARSKDLHLVYVPARLRRPTNYTVD